MLSSSLASFADWGDTQPAYFTGFLNKEMYIYLEYFAN